MQKVRKRRDPTMEILQVGAEESEDKLYQQFKNLQRDWDTFKQSNPRTLRRCLTDSNTIIKTLQLLNNSPRDLMSSLQYRRSPSEAVEEILRERRAAIESGKLKGRRLFGGLEGATEMAFEGREEICNDCFDLVQESEVRSVSSYGSHAENVNCASKEEVPSGCCHCCSCSGSSLSGEKVESEMVVEGKEGAKVGEKRDGSGLGGNGGKWMFVMGWFTIALMAFTLGLISMRCNAGYEDEDEVTLVPT